MKEEKNGKTNKRQYRRYFIMAFSLVLCLSAVSAIASKYISNLAISNCYRGLKDLTVQYAAGIRTDMEYDLELLEVIADNMAGQEDITSEETRELFSMSEAGVMLDTIALLLPDGRVYASDEALLKNLRAISYEEEAAAGAHVSARIADINDRGKYYLYHFVPVMRDGVTEGLLCGVIDLEKLRQKYMENLEEGTSFQLMEGRSGAFLIDSMHPLPGEAESLRNRTVKKGYSVDQVLADMENGAAGKTAFFSTTLQEYIYCVYEPVGINGWMVMLGQPEDIILRDARNIRIALRHFILFETTVFLLYLMFVFWGVRKAFHEREKELDRVQYILKIEELLFNAAGNSGQIKEALEVIAGKLSAEYAFFIIYDANGSEKMYIWTEHAAAGHKIYQKEDFPKMCARLLTQGNILTYDIKEITGDTGTEYQELKKLGITSLMSIPVIEPGHTHIGSLGVANMKRRFQSAELLECVMLIFSMAVKNIASFQEVEKMGNRDNLTGLKNRNSYQNGLEAYGQEQGTELSCIYVDADGLHEINNRYGHEAGDNLLRTVADALKEEFGEEDSYRIGGDEFVVFCPGMNPEQTKQKLRKAKKNIGKKGYHISVGMESRKNKPFIYEMVKQAEINMFEAKRIYHEGRGDVQNMRGMDRKLEKTLMEKRDLDVFRSVLSSKYLGVYIVDLKIDTFRFIYIPSYFNEAAEQSGGRFSEAVRLYVESYVLEEYHQAFMQLLDYSKVEEHLNRGEEPELIYQRPDGVAIMLKIYRSPEYDDSCRESIWTFEKVLK